MTQAVFRGADHSEVNGLPAGRPPQAVMSSQRCGRGRASVMESQLLPTGCYPCF